ncbi:hypothetical protein ACIQNU_05705 [Streptomyces sp. NPDC091292]|uniref:hypothetical protein n=1 Tax=Streptomyces sp. NPDC091292 TaxID=3365991 RepID=UPI003803ECDA
MSYAALPVALLVLATGCSPETSTRTGGQPAEAPDPTDQVLALVLPFDKYEPTQQESYRAAKARDFLIEECMEKRGHEWEILRYPTHVDEMKNRRRYGVIEIQVAREFGYHANSAILSGETDVPRQRDERDKRLDADGIQAAYNEKSGCGYKANDVLVPAEAGVDHDLFNRLSSSLLTKAKKDTKVVQVTRNWAKCMRERGYAYKTPDEAIGDPRWWKRKSDKPTSDEREVAVADVQCKSQVSLVDTLFTTESGIQAQAIKQHHAYFSKLSAAQTKYLARINEVIEAKGTP